ncbi:MAG: hypothetical protein OXU27_06425 [Candidatus Poribacteria bacterium]|nr:hypothetical protein [Candidatus Poribacteria bacterium]
MSTSTKQLPSRTEGLVAGYFSCRLTYQNINLITETIRRFKNGMSRFGLEEFSMKIIRQLISLFFETDKQDERTLLTPETREKFAAFYMMFPF